MMGYVSPGQQTKGIHMRLWSRAFVFVDAKRERRLVFVSADLGMIFQCIRQQVIERLQSEFDGIYGEANVILSATHTHSGPGGYSYYRLYYLTCGGFDRANAEVIVDGILQSIRKAHQNLTPATIALASGDLPDASANRSRKAYDENPESERSEYETDTDKAMTLLRIRGTNGNEIGSLNWFAVHGTSLGNDNKLISGDNKGLASYLVEREFGADYCADRTYVAAFAQTNEGDVTPNLVGDGDGGGVDDFDSLRISAEKQASTALRLLQQAIMSIDGFIDSRIRYLDFSQIELEASAEGEPRKTCRAALGLSMLAGTEDGRGVGNEGTSKFKKLLTAPFRTECQAEKDVVLKLAEAEPPLAPEVLPLQLGRLGPLAIIAVPFELTTMSGRRLRNTVLERLRHVGVEYAVIAGLSNAYAGYVTTREEYSSQHYEGGSTHFGPWTLSALQKEFSEIALQLATGESTPIGPMPRRSTGRLLSLRPGVLVDASIPLRRIGRIHTQPHARYSKGSSVSTSIWGGHPRNDFLTQSSYFEIQRRLGDSWVIVARDWDPETTFHWDRRLLLFSLITVWWTIPSHAEVGRYRILIRGHRKPLFRRPRLYQVISSEFEVHE